MQNKESFKWKTEVVFAWVLNFGQKSVKLCVKTAVSLYNDFEILLGTLAPLVLMRVCFGRIKMEWLVIGILCFGENSCFTVLKVIVMIRKCEEFVDLAFA